jgi:hypothetical protein
MPSELHRIDSGDLIDTNQLSDSLSEYMAKADVTMRSDTADQVYNQVRHQDHVIFWECFHCSQRLAVFSSGLCRIFKCKLNQF